MRIPQLITTELRCILRAPDFSDSVLDGASPGLRAVCGYPAYELPRPRETRKRGGCGFRPSAAPLCAWIAEAERNGSDFQMALPGYSFFATQVITEPGSVTMISNSSPLVSMAKKACDVIPKGAIWTV